MDRLAVSVLNELGERLFSAEFSSHSAAKNFIDLRIEDLLVLSQILREDERQDSRPLEAYAARA